MDNTKILLDWENMELGQCMWFEHLNYEVLRVPTGYVITRLADEGIASTFVPYTLP